MSKVEPINYIPSYENFQKVQAKLVGFIMAEDIEATDDDVIREFLIAQGYEDTLVDYTCDWLTTVIRSGKLTETIDIIHQKSIAGVRIENPFDIPYLSDEIWKKVESWRLRGIIPYDVVERLLVGLRNMDVRDWDEDEVSDLVANLLAPAFDTKSAEQEDLLVLEDKISESLYC
jgi:hypothetical protein